VLVTIPAVLEALIVELSDIAVEFVHLFLLSIYVNEQRLIR